jgi:hypothetical protein
VIVGKSVHQDDRRILAGNIAHEVTAMRRVDPSPFGEHIRFRHRPFSFIALPRLVTGVTDALSFTQFMVSTP